MEMVYDDLTRIIEKLMAIHEDTQAIRQLLEEDDDEADEEDDDPHPGP